MIVIISPFYRRLKEMILFAHSLRVPFRQVFYSFRMHFSGLQSQSHPKTMSKTALVLATNGTEDIELVVTIDVLRRANVNVCVCIKDFSVSSFRSRLLDYPTAII